MICAMDWDDSGTERKAPNVIPTMILQKWSHSMLGHLALEANGWETLLAQGSPRFQSVLGQCPHLHEVIALIKQVSQSPTPGSLNLACSVMALGQALCSISPCLSQPSWQIIVAPTVTDTSPNHLGTHPISLSLVHGGGNRSREFRKIKYPIGQAQCRRET